MPNYKKEGMAAALVDMVIYMTIALLITSALGIESELLKDTFIFIALGLVVIKHINPMKK